MLADAALPHLLLRRLRVLPLPATHAPTASGWSNSCRVGYLPPTGSTPLFTAHEICGLAGCYSFGVGLPFGGCFCGGCGLGAGAGALACGGGLGAGAGALACGGGLGAGAGALACGGGLGAGAGALACGGGLGAGGVTCG
jgi:hypothetical protein